MFKLVNDTGGGSNSIGMQVFLCVLYECEIFCQVFSVGLILFQMGAKDDSWRVKKKIDPEFTYCKKTFFLGIFVKII